VPRTIPLVVSIAFFLQLLDATIMNTSLPQMSASFGVHLLDMGLGVTSYSLALACTLPLAGWIATRFGAKLVLVVATGLFLVGSLGCAAADRFSLFIAARVLQGIGGAAMNPVGRLIVLRTTPRSELLEATNTITWPGLVAPLAGPLVGGFITSQLGWRWNFILNIPIGLGCMWLTLKLVPRFEPERTSRLDLKGFVLASSAMGALLSGLGAVSDGDWGWAAWLSLGWGIVGGAMAWFHLRQVRAPVVDLAVLKIPSFRLASLTAGMFVRVAVGAVPFLLPIMLQSVLGFGPLEAGAYLSVYFAGNFLGLFVATPVLRSFGFRKVMLANPVLVGASIAGLFLITPGFSKGLAWAMLFLGGVVRSVQFTGQSSLAYAEVPQTLDADASTLASVLLQVSASLSVVFATAALSGVQRITGEGRLGLSTFRGTFLIMAALPLLTAWLFRRLPFDAGQALVGARRRRALPVDGAAEVAET